MVRYYTIPTQQHRCCVPEALAEALRSPRPCVPEPCASDAMWDADPARGPNGLQ